MEKNYYIFGAHSRGRTLYEYLKTLEPQDKMLGFLFDNNEDNPEEADGVLVIDIAKKSGTSLIDNNAAVYIATRGEYHEGIIRHLNKLGFSEIIPVTPGLDMDLRNIYVKRRFCKNGKRFHKIDIGAACENREKSEDNDRVCLFIVKTSDDCDFEKPVPPREYEKIIQAGCALTDVRLPEADYFDYQPSVYNISERNTQCCELTALYWIWKYAAQDIVGLEHWRRRFLLPDEWAGRMERDGIDVILPVPLCVMPSIEENFKGRHDPKVWDTTMEILGEVHPEEYERAVSYFRENNLYSPCNMLIARKAVLDDYCAWMFPVVLELNDRIGEIADKYQNRYPGFVSERILTYFFDSRSDKYKVAYADKSFLR